MYEPKTKSANFVTRIQMHFECNSLGRMDDCGALRDLMPFVQFKKREKHPWRSVTFSKVAGYSNFIYFN